MCIRDDIFACNNKIMNCESLLTLNDLLMHAYKPT